MCFSTVMILLSNDKLGLLRTHFESIFRVLIKAENDFGENQNIHMCVFSAVMIV